MSMIYDGDVGIFERLSLNSDNLCINEINVEWIAPSDVNEEENLWCYSLLLLLVCSGSSGR